MKRFVYIVVVVSGYWANGGVAVAAIVQEMNLEGIGTDVPIDSFSFSMFGYPNGHSNSGGGSTTKPTVSDVVITRMLDASSPKLLEAAAKGKVFKKVEIQQCKNDCIAPSTSLKFLLDNVVISSYMLGPASDPIPTESITMAFEKMKLTYIPDPIPPRTAWGAILPATLPVGGTEPYHFNFNLDAQTVEALFNRPLSPLGDLVPAALLNTSAVPEPSTVWLVVTGLLIAASGLRRGRCS